MKSPTNPGRFSSHTRAGAAWEAGVFRREVSLTKDGLDRDEVIRSDTSATQLAGLSTLIAGPTSTVTAGNSSALADGASASLLGNLEAANSYGFLAQIVGVSTVGNAPHLFGMAPALAIHQVLDRLGLTPRQLDVVEISEAFSAQVLSVLKLIDGLDEAKVNTAGGGISLGHPLGASGARIIGHVAHRLHERGGGVGLATVCIGMGQAIAVVLRR